MPGLSAAHNGKKITSVRFSSTSWGLPHRFQRLEGKSLGPGRKQRFGPGPYVGEELAFAVSIQRRLRIPMAVGIAYGWLAGIGVELQVPAAGKMPDVLLALVKNRLKLSQLVSLKFHADDTNDHGEGVKGKRMWGQWVA